MSQKTNILYGRPLSKKIKAENVVIPLLDKGANASLFIQGSEYVDFEKVRLRDLVDKVTDYIVSIFKKSVGRNWKYFALVVMVKSD